MSLKYMLLAGAAMLLIGSTVACSSNDSSSATAQATATQQEAESSLPTVTVFKSPTCGCCNNWVAHLERSGFTVTTQDLEDVTPVKRRLEVPWDLSSCHTAVVDGYVVEGHVPADDIKQLLQERPDVTGLAVPGMPIGSPGMEGPNPEAYEVVAFSRHGERSTFAQH